MDERTHLEALRAMEELKNAPEWMQNMNLVMICKLDPTGMMEPIARTLASYDIPSEKIIPCIMDLMKIMDRKFVSDMKAKALLEHGVE